MQQIASKYLPFLFHSMLFLLLWAAGQTALNAQTAAGTISGTVTDSSGAVIQRFQHCQPERIQHESEYRQLNRLWSGHLARYPGLQLLRTTGRAIRSPCFLLKERKRNGSEYGFKYFPGSDRN